MAFSDDICIGIKILKLGRVSVLSEGFCSMVGLESASYINKLMGSRRWNRGIRRMDFLLPPLTEIILNETFNNFFVAQYVWIG